LLGALCSFCARTVLIFDPHIQKHRTNYVGSVRQKAGRSAPLRFAGGTACLPESRRRSETVGSFDAPPGRLIHESHGCSLRQV
jgi:hypothetical protein